MEFHGGPAQHPLSRLNWRSMTAADLDAVAAIAAVGFPDHFEGRDCFENRLALNPSGSFVLAAEDSAPLGYLVAYPWTADAAPALNTLIAAIPDDASVMHLHDLAIDPAARGRVDGEVVQMHHRGVVRDRGDQRVERGGGVRGPRIGDQIAERRAILGGEHERAGRVQGQPVFETVAALEMIREADGGDGGDGVQIGRRHRPPVQAGQRVLSGAAVKFHSMLRAWPPISPSIRAVRVSPSRS